MAWWHRGQGGHGPPGMTVKERQKTKMKILIEQSSTLPLFSVEDQLRVTFKERKRAS